MRTELLIQPHQDNRDLCFGELKVRHHGCLTPAMRISRILPSEHHRLVCNCGLDIELLTESAEDAFIFTSIDELDRVLPAGSYTSNQVTDLVLRPDAEGEEVTR